jgi:urease accessory protein
VTVDLGEGCAFLMADVICPGRIGRGEIFAYDLLQRVTTLSRNRAEIAVDAMSLEPSRWAPGRRGVFGCYTHLVSLLLAPPGSSTALAERLQHVARDLPGVLGGASTLPNDAGVVVRVLASSLIAAAGAVDVLWSVVRTSLRKGTPPRRRK